MSIKSIVMALVGFCPAAQSIEMSRMRAASRQHTAMAERGQRSALDILDRQDAEPQGSDISESSRVGHALRKAASRTW